MNYRKVQFIAYCINTAPKAEWNGTNWQQKYLGYQDPLRDIQERIALVKKAIDIAYQNSDRQTQILKIFMIPEFFFRGVKGAYTMPKVHKVVEGLQVLVKDKKWENWIFVFGSIVGFSSPTKTVIRQGRTVEEIDPSEPKEIYNFTLVQQGGFGQVKDAHNYARVVMKELKSGIDFIKANDIIGGGLVLERVIPLSTVNEEKRKDPASANIPIEKRDEFSDLNFAGTSIFDMKGIRFGLELCLDHAAKRLKESTEYQNNTGDGIVDIQLIPSCGMSIDTDAVVVRNGGYVFNCDGLSKYNNSENGGKQINIGGNLHYDSHSALLTKRNGIFDELNNQVQKYDINQDVREIYASGSGQLHIYSPQALSTASSTLSSSTSLFPRSESSFTTALSSEPILLNGMKVIFDQSVSVYPVSLQPKTISTQLEKIHFGFAKGKSKKPAPKSAPKQDIGGAPLSWTPQTEVELMRFATEEEVKQLRTNNNKYGFVVRHKGSNRSAVWFIDKEMFSQKRYTADFASKRPYILNTRLSVTNQDFINFENVDPESPTGFQGEAEHPNQVIVKSNEEGAYGIGRNLIDQNPITVTKNPNFKK